MADVTLPQLGETVTEGTITRWFKQVGDQVAADEPLRGPRAAVTAGDLVRDLRSGVVLNSVTIAWGAP